MAANRFLNQHVAREEFGFDGLFTSDCGDVRNVRRNSTDEVCRAALSDGNLSVNCGGFLPAHLGAAVANGAVSEEMIDAALRRTWEASITLGNFDTPNERTAIPASAIDSPEHRALALEAAKDGVTLLKNEQKALPLDAEQTVALVGPAANATFVMQSNYQGYSRLILQNSPLLRMRSRGPVRYAAGCEYARNATEESIAEAVKLAKGAAAAVVMVGIVPDGSAGSDPRAFETEGHNRPDITLPGNIFD